MSTELSLEDGSTEIILDYIMQGNRYDIYEDFGCVPSITRYAVLVLLDCMFKYLIPFWSTWMTLVLNSSWPLLIGLASCIYGGEKLRLYLWSKLTGRPPSFRGPIFPFPPPTITSKLVKPKRPQHGSLLSAHGTCIDRHFGRCPVLRFQFWRQYCHWLHRTI